MAVAPDAVAEAQRMVRQAKAVVLDFDGPICALFGRHHAPGVAQRLCRELERRGCLPAELVDCQDPHQVLRELRLRLLAKGWTPARAIAEEDRIAASLTSEEVTAAGTAPPTHLAAELIRTLAARGTGLAVVSNNSKEAVDRHLREHGLLDVFSGPVIGRPKDPRRIKPDPGELLRAVDQLGLSGEPRPAVLIGDSAADFLAARRAGTGFVGFRCSEASATALSSCGAGVAVDSLEPLLLGVTPRR
ncbi:HAD family hydrolase [Streptacidiphilus carbonis]|jgi:phosphoglycolate phosphatase|uniref:HAD family hydrolase n=1 Tax=Streptacidiphilus carbonis TaxID=105422 RepID=UPI0005A69961|nr:HAD family hydrolase [Streptacidiphilus carbonis]